jgi:hypothetical protein
MSAPTGTACPPWCDQPAGHLHIEAAGPGDYHLSEFTTIDLPHLPGLRNENSLQITIEQYVTATTTYQTVIALGYGAEGADDAEALTLDEADALAAALIKAVTRARATGTGQPSNDAGAA